MLSFMPDHYLVDLSDDLVPANLCEVYIDKKKYNEWTMPRPFRCFQA